MLGKVLVPGEAESWVPGAKGSHFPLQNLPIANANLPDGTQSLVVGIGSKVISIAALADQGVVEGRFSSCRNGVADLTIGDFRYLRQSMWNLLRSDAALTSIIRANLESAMFESDQVRFLLPCSIPSYTDFYSGIHHASNVGRMFRPGSPPLLPNYRYVPVAYNGRASTVTPSGSSVARPAGQIRPNKDSAPILSPTRELDFEAELGFFVSKDGEGVSHIQVDSAEDYILGFTVVNDWSARDIQRWENQPLGPFLSKSFQTSVSPWIVSLDALEPFRCLEAPQEPAPLPYLRSASAHHFNLDFEVTIKTAKMEKWETLSRTNSRYLYWSCAQQLAHLTSNGLRCVAGELCASGTISGPQEGSFGSLIELSWNGEKPVRLECTGETRSYLDDGDEVCITAFGQSRTHRIGVGSVSGRVVGA